MSRVWLRAGGAVLLTGAAALILAACESNDPTAPADSTIDVSANPQTVVVPSGGGVGTTEITATVRSKNGTRLPDQEISFSTSSGTMDPPADTFLETDDEGQARALLITSTAATVTARSGSISNTTQVQTATGDLATFVLNVDPDILSSCQDTLDIRVDVRTTSGDPVPGILVIFDSSGDVSGSFNPDQVTSDAGGIATSVFTPNAAVCQAQCASPSQGGDPNSPTPGTCELFIEAGDITHTFDAVPKFIFDNVP